MKSGNLNFLEHSGPPQACNGTALPLPLLVTFMHWIDNNYAHRPEDESCETKRALSV